MWQQQKSGDQLLLLNCLLELLVTLLVICRFTFGDEGLLQ